MRRRETVIEAKRLQKIIFRVRESVLGRIDAAEIKMGLSGIRLEFNGCFEGPDRRADLPLFCQSHTEIELRPGDKFGLVGRYPATRAGLRPAREKPADV